MGTRRRMTRRAVIASCAGGLGGCIKETHWGDAPPPGSVQCRRQYREKVRADTETDWTTAKYEPTNTGYAPEAISPAECPTLKWTARPGVERLHAIRIRDGTIYVSGDPAKGPRQAVLTALDADTGAEQWKMEGDGAREITIEGDTIYRTKTSASLQAVDLNTQSPRWFGGYGTTTSARVLDGVVYAGGALGDVVALDAVDGNERWHRVFYAPGETGPTTTGRDTIRGVAAVPNGDVYVTHTFGQCTALDADTGDNKWKFETKNVIGQGPAVVDDSVYIVDSDVLYALDRKSGEKRWQTNLTEKRLGSVRCSPTVTEDTVYVVAGVDSSSPDPPQRLIALARSNGQQLWTEGISFLRDEIVIAGDTLYLPVGPGLSAREISSGRERWFFRTTHNGRQTWMIQTPIVSTGQVFAIGWYGPGYSAYVYALGTKGS